MKTENLMVVSQLMIAGCHGREALDYYSQSRSRLDMSNWCDITDPYVVDPNLLRRFCIMRIKPFRVNVLSYKTSNWHHYMDQKRALSLISKIGCRPLSLVQTLFVACQTIRTGEMRDMSLTNDFRDQVSIVPTSPEFARFYYFARTRSDSGSFGVSHYTIGKIEARNPNGRKLFYDQESALYADLRSPLLLCEEIK